MKISLRVILVVACSYLFAPLLARLLRVAIGADAGVGPGLGFLAVGWVVFGACAVGAFLRKRWTRWVLLIWALLWTVWVLLYTFATPAGLFGVLSLIHAAKAAREADVVTYAAQATFRYLSRQSVEQMKAPQVYGESTRYMATSGLYELVTFTRAGRIRQVDAHFNKDELRWAPRDPTFLIP